MVVLKMPLEDAQITDDKMDGKKHIIEKSFSKQTCQHVMTSDLFSHLQY